MLLLTPPAKHTGSLAPFHIVYLSAGVQSKSSVILGPRMNLGFSGIQRMIFLKESEIFLSPGSGLTFTPFASIFLSE